ncbi:MAG: CPBP family intramembrane metalloprotease [Lentisphaerae bacterium]|nr:MAG: CPBP family intramembrane metalloprotease [Lentisphaerota bacterium]
MRFKQALIITRKEILETLKDRRTLFLMLGLPVILYPALIVGFGQVIAHQYSAIRNSKYSLLIAGRGNQLLKQWFKGDPQLTLVNQRIIRPVMPEFVTTKPHTPAANAPAGNDPGKMNPPEAIITWCRQVTSKYAIDIIICPEPSFTREVENERQGRCWVFYNMASDTSQIALQYIQDRLEALRAHILDERQKNHPELPPFFLHPLRVESVNIASAQQRGGYFAGRILPMIMIIMVMLGAFYPAVDMTAGEKERGTMETLLTVPVTPAEIIAGKFIAVFLIAFSTALANLGSMSLALLYMLQTGNIQERVQFQMSIGSGMMVFVQLIPVAVLFSSVILGVAVLARSFKEAQNYLTPFYLLIIIPIAVSSLPGFSLTTTTAFFPVINLCLLMREMFIHSPAVELIVIVLAANSVYAFLALWAAAYIFHHESILLDGGIQDLRFTRMLTPQKKVPEPSLGLLFAAFVWVVYLYLGSILQSADLFWGLTFSQIAFLLLPVIATIYFARFSWRATLSLNRPPLRGVGAAILCGTTTWLTIVPLVMAIQNMFLPEPPAIREAMERLISGQLHGIPFAARLFLFALLPAVCEELFFRGFVLGALRHRLKPFHAIVITGLIFGFYHISIYRMLPTAIIGILAGWFLLRSNSIFCTILFHFLHNATSLCVVTWLHQHPDMREEQLIRVTTVVPAMLLFLCGIWLLKQKKSPQKNDDYDLQTPRS